MLEKIKKKLLDVEFVHVKTAFVFSILILTIAVLFMLGVEIPTVFDETRNTSSYNLINVVFLVFSIIGVTVFVLVFIIYKRNLKIEENDKKEDIEISED
jgi:hypothetical protein